MSIQTPKSASKKFRGIILPLRRTFVVSKQVAIKFTQPSALRTSMFRYQLAHINRARSGLLRSSMNSISQLSSPRDILEENQHPHYDSRKYYPAHTGETIHKRYSIISKLGWGANSTVWLAKDINR